MQLTKRILTLAALLFSAAAFGIEPSGTYLFASKDSTDLYLDVYNPAPDSPVTVDGKQKPTIIFIFGGGFKEGERYSEAYGEWFEYMCGRGYRVVSIDYRLGLKGCKKMGLAQVKLLGDAINMAVEDLFSATSFLVENASELGIDPANVVVSGSSAGAITSLQAEWEISNSGELSKMLPERFNYAGVMAFSGAVLSFKGFPSFPKEPCPMLILHGTADRLVTYGKLGFLSTHFVGGASLAPVLEKGNCNYRVYRFKDIGHEICCSMYGCRTLEEDFLERNVVKGQKVVIDALVDDPFIEHLPNFSSRDAKSYYK